MALAFYLRRRFDRGAPVGSSKIFVSAHGTLVVSEERDDAFRRIVRTARFTRVDDGELIPPLRDVRLLAWTGETIVLTGNEQLNDGKVEHERLYAQTWLLTPESCVELERVERLFGRAVGHLRAMGVSVEMTARGGMRIAGETRPDDGHPVIG